MMGDQATARKVREAVESWTPSEVMSHERKYQSELQDYLDAELNSGGDLLDDGQEYVVSTERGTSRGDVVVDDVVGIEMKRNFSNSQKKKLRGQLEDYSDNYPYVIALACGVDDRDGWRELKNKYEDQRQMGFDPESTEFTFIAKDRSTFGTGKEAVTSEPDRGSDNLDLSGDDLDIGGGNDLFDGEGDEELGPFGIAGVGLIVGATMLVAMPLSGTLLNVGVAVAAFAVGGAGAYAGFQQQSED